MKHAGFRKPKYYTRDFRIAISLAEPDDADIIRFLETARWGDKARVVRAALRFYWKERRGEFYAETTSP